MVVTLGEVAGLVAAIALCVLVGVTIIPLLKLGRTLDEIRSNVRDLREAYIPVLSELKRTVENTDEEVVRLAAVTEELSEVTAQAQAATEDAAGLSHLLATTLGRPIVRGAAIAHGVQTAIKGRKK